MRRKKASTVPAAIFWPRLKALARKLNITQYIRHVMNERIAMGSLKICLDSFKSLAQKKPLKSPREKKMTPADK